MRIMEQKKTRSLRAVTHRVPIGRITPIICGLLALLVSFGRLLLFDIVFWPEATAAAVLEINRHAIVEVSSRHISFNLSAAALEINRDAVTGGAGNRHSYVIDDAAVNACPDG